MSPANRPTDRGAGKSGAGRPESGSSEDRLAAKLRENLARRKAQQRARRDTADSGERNDPPSRS